MARFAVSYQTCKTCTTRYIHYRASSSWVFYQKMPTKKVLVNCGASTAGLAATGCATKNAKMNLSIAGLAPTGYSTKKRKKNKSVNRGPSSSWVLYQKCKNVSCQSRRYAASPGGGHSVSLVDGVLVSLAIFPAPPFRNVVCRMNTGATAKVARGVGAGEAGDAVMPSAFIVEVGGEACGVVAHAPQRGTDKSFPRGCRFYRCTIVRV